MSPTTRAGQTTPAHGAQIIALHAQEPKPSKRPDASLRWYAVNTLPRSEARARANLERQGWRCYSPLLLKTSRNGRKLITQLRPLFPSYIFVELDPGTAGWRSIDSTYGVRSIVKQNGRPASLPADCVDALIAMTNEHGVFSFSRSISPGSSVQFVAGAFSGLIGTLEAVDAHGRIAVLLSLLGQTTRVRANTVDVIPAVTRAAE